MNTPKELPQVGPISSQPGNVQRVWVDFRSELAMGDVIASVAKTASEGLTVTSLEVVPSDESDEHGVQIMAARGVRMRVSATEIATADVVKVVRLKITTGGGDVQEFDLPVGVTGAR